MSNEGKLDYIPALDGLRAVACLMVLACHCTPLRELLNLDERIGMDGVVIFFALSGFLITRILLDDRREGRGWAQFFIRRASRIFPVYYATLLACWCYWRFPDLKWQALYLADIKPGFTAVMHLWSLSVEEQFYLLWPLVVLFTPTKISRAAAWVVAVGGVGLMVVHDVWKFSRPDGVYWALAQYAAMLAFGGLSAYYAYALRRGAAAGPATVIAGVATLCYLADFPAVASSLPVRNPFPDSALPGDLLHVVWPLSVFAYALCVRPGWLAVRPLRYLGRISYGIYLFHLPIFKISDSVQGIPTLAGAAVTWVVVIGLAALSYRFFERPVMDAVRSRLPAKAAPVVVREAA